MAISYNFLLGLMRKCAILHVHSAIVKNYVEPSVGSVTRLYFVFNVEFLLA